MTTLWSNLFEGMIVDLVTHLVKVNWSNLLAYIFDDRPTLDLTKWFNCTGSRIRGRHRNKDQFPQSAKHRCCWVLLQGREDGQGHGVVGKFAGFYMAAITNKDSWFAPFNPTYAVERNNVFFGDWSQAKSSVKVSW